MTFEPFKNAPFNINDLASLALFIQTVSNAERADANKPSLETAASGRSNSTRAKDHIFIIGTPDAKVRNR